MFSKFLFVVRVLCLFTASLSVQAQTTLYFIHNDHLGRPQVVTDQNQQVVWEAKKKPFGEMTETTSTINLNTRFPGQYFDQESGYHYNYYRDYDPALGRYIQSDPIGLRGGLNTYGYVHQNPLIYIDPYGKDSVKAAILQASLRGNFKQAQFLIQQASTLTGKQAQQFANQCASKYGGQLVKQFKTQGVGTGARSGQHGVPFSRAGAQLQRMANQLPKNSQMAQALRNQAKQLLNRAKSINH